MTDISMSKSNDKGNDKVEDVLYLDAVEHRLCAVMLDSEFNMPSNIDFDIKKNIVYNVLFDQTRAKFPDYEIMEVGYLFRNDDNDCVYFAVSLKMDTIEKIVKPALHQGKVVVFGDVQSKQYTISKNLKNFGFERTMDNYDVFHGSNGNGEVNTFYDWSCGNLYV